MGRIPMSLLALATSAAVVPAQEPKEAFEVQMRAEERYRTGDYDGCLEELEALWARHPPGSEGWARCTSVRREWFPGHPVSYSALRMLDECARWRVGPACEGRRTPKPMPVTWTVVLVGATRGPEPRTQEELDAATGVEVRHELDPRLVADDHRVMRRATWLFREFVTAITEGRLQVELRFLQLADLELPVGVSTMEGRYASGLVGDAWDRLWAAVPEDVRRTTDWWWVVYPSHVPDGPAFATTEFVSGGMATGPDGASPCFLVDDLWLLRKPPHLGEGDYSDEERRAYLPQWLAHEFFHHLFRNWPEFGLEARSHQWFDRSTWPSDFEGCFEVDYHLEALHRRLQPRALPPLHVGLLYAPPPQEVWKRFRVADLLGHYERRPVENDWHRGRIVRSGRRKGNPVLRWVNEAGASWELFPDLEHGVLLTGEGDPYAEGGPRTLSIQLRHDGDGTWSTEVVGFRSGGELYLKLD